VLGEGVDTVTVTRGAASASVTMGFYVDGAHSCFLAQSVDGDYNSTLSDLDAVATWVNLRPSELDVTQGVGAAQPTFRTGIVGGQPVVRCDGGDRVAASTASDWIFLVNGTDWTVDANLSPTLANPGVNSMIVVNGPSSPTTNYMFAAHRDLSVNEGYIGRLYNAASATTIALNGSANTFPVMKFSILQAILDDNGGAGDDAFAFVNAANAGTAASTAAYASAAAAPLNICAFSDGGNALTGDLFRVLIYQSALTSTQRGINKAVDEWALGGTLPVTP
jgi:hypothetical protein